MSADEIRVRQPDGAVSSLRLADLITVAIETNDSGPWGADVWWRWEAPSPAVLYPQGATGDREALTFLQTLEGFDDRAVIKAMGLYEHSNVCGVQQTPVTPRRRCLRRYKR